MSASHSVAPQGAKVALQLVPSTGKEMQRKTRTDSVFMQCCSCSWGERERTGGKGR